MDLNIHQILLSWGQMARENGCKGYPTMESFAKEMKRVIHHQNKLDDKTYCEIDRLFIVLYQQDETQYKILRDRYILNLKPSEISRKWNISKSQVHIYLSCAKAFILGGIMGRGFKIWQ